jgi:hypothetical protein
MDSTIETTIARIQERAADNSLDRTAIALVGLMPKGGISLSSGTDYTRVRLVSSLVSALVAYCDQWDDPVKTEPLDDVAVYAAMLNSLDGLLRRRDRIMMAAFTQPGPTGSDRWQDGYDLSTADKITEAQVAVDSTMSGDETARRRGYTPST